jgi:hypothetical protein
MKCISSHADTEGYHTIDYLVTGFNAFVAEGKRDLIIFLKVLKSSRISFIEYAQQMKSVICASAMPSLFRRCRYRLPEIFAFSDDDRTEVVYPTTSNHEDTSRALVPSDVVALDYKPKREKPVKMLHMDATLLSSLFQ